MKNYCPSLTCYLRRPSREVKVGTHRIGGSAPVVVQTMTNTRTLDTEGSVAQIEADRKSVV